MSLLDRLRPAWRHADPAVRQDAVRRLTDQKLIAEIVANDLSEEVRLAAVEAMTDQITLARLALTDGVLALAAAGRLTDPAAIAQVARSAKSVPVRRRAVERATDPELLRKVAGFDADAGVRALARAKSAEADPTSGFLKDALTKLQVADGTIEPVAEFCGSLDEVSRALMQDQRFLINGGVAADGEEAGAAQVHEVTQAPWARATLDSQRVIARFVAQTRSAESGPPRFYHIKVWRTAADRFNAVAVEKQVAATNDAETWSRASGSASGVQPAFGSDAHPA